MKKRNLQQLPLAAMQSLEQSCEVDLAQSLSWICSALCDVEPQQEPQLQRTCPPECHSVCHLLRDGSALPRVSCLVPCSRRGHPPLQLMNQLQEAPAQLLLLQAGRPQT